MTMLIINSSNPTSGKTSNEQLYLHTSMPEKADWPVHAVAVV